MKTAGLLGGIGPESTIDYYRRIIAACDQAPPLVINSIDVRKLLHLLANDRPGAIDYLAREIQRLADAHVDFAAIAANTPHVVFDEVRERSAIPLINIVDAVRSAARAAGLKRLAVFGTRITMRERLYPDAILPSPEEQDLIHDKYVNELLNGKFLPQTRDRFLKIVEEMIRRDRIDAVILGGTELPLLLREESYRGVTFLDTTAIHARAIVDAIHSDAAI